MATADRYSRLVLWLKVALPLVALAILSTLFFVAETLDPDAAIPYAKVDVERILREQGVTKPTFGGVTSNGVAISLSAASVRPEPEDRNQLTGTALEATLDLPQGGSIRIESPIGIVNADTEMAVLQGGATLKSSTGYVVEASEIAASLASASVTASSTVTAVGPPGEITAGQMALVQTQDPTESYLLVFKDGVRLLYQPQNVRKPQ
jgi:lipopolysaccharide export system protein LptC